MKNQKVYRVTNMEKWKMVKIEDVITTLGDGLHGTPQYETDGEYAFINGNNLINGKIVIKNDTRRVNENEYKKYKKDLNDRTLMISINGTLGNVGEYFGEKVMLGKSICYFNVKSSINKKYIKYIISSQKFKEYLEINATGTTIKNVSLKQMREYVFPLPNKEIQDKVSFILEKIDDKIELNNKINKNLLFQGQILFDKTYCLGKPTTLNSLIDITESGSRPKGGAENQGIPSLGAEKIECFGIYDFSNEKYISDEFYKNLKRGKVMSGDVLLYKDGAYTGKVSMSLDGFPYNKCAINEHVFIIRTKNFFAQFFLYFLLSKNENKQQIIAMASSKAAQPGLNSQELSSINILLPENKIINEFEKTISPLMHRIAINAKENKNLAFLRDSLLPKLMSGEIDVSKIDI